MKTLSQYGGEHLSLVQPSIWKRVYHLRTKDAVLLTMTFPKVFSSLTVVEGFGERWEFKKTSFWRSDIEIKRANDHLPFAKYISQRWGKGGTFELPRGERIEYLFNMWKRTNELFSQQKIKLVSFQKESLWKTSLAVIIERESELLEMYPWIIMVIYSQILQRRQQASHTV